MYLKAMQVVFFLYVWARINSIVQDPAVQEATAPVKDGQEDYNPFSEEPKNPEVSTELWELDKGLICEQPSLMWLAW